MYAELHAASGFSFLEGASQPEDLVAEAARFGYEALALCDRDSVSGAPRFYKAARQAGLRPLVGCELSLDEPGIKKGSPSAIRDRRLTVLIENRRGYQNLCRLLTRMNTRAPKGEGRAAWRDIEDFAPGMIALLSDLQDGDPVRAIFGPRNVYVELQRHLRREQESENLTRIGYARQHKLPLLATNGVRYARRSDKGLFDALTCLRHKTVLDRAGRLLDANAERRLKTPAAMAKLFADVPEAVCNASELARRVQFTLENLGYEFPRFPLPRGETMTSYLRTITLRGALERYRHTTLQEKALRQIEHELRVIEKLRLEGYFLIVWDLVEFCRRHNILAQGRGSAANSAVCYSLGITAVDPVGMELLFERFLSEERGEWPDIDIDLPSGDQRERVIQHVYDRYGASGAGMTANVITYRGKSAVREMGKVLGFPEEMIGRLSKCIHPFEYTDKHDALEQQVRTAGLDATHVRVQHLIRLCMQIQSLPRHLGQHSGGMVICQGDLDSIVPLENARMPNRRVVQWDKEDCADLGIIKVDLLGLGMMAALEESITTIRSRGGDFDLAKIPPNDPQTYAMIQKADTIGVFQIESRAQMATLPRLKPTCFYDLVVEVAIIRPGPIVGDMAHPYLNRRQGREPVTYAHPSLEPILKRTLGVPLFQEQLLRMAMTAAGFSGGEAEELRRAMGFKRSVERMKEIEEKLRRGLANNGITGAVAEQIVRSITAFALYGFPESHSASFALLAYASAYLKAHYPAEFTAALLNCQPMGFYSPAVLVKDAQRHGVRVRPIDAQVSDARCAVESSGVIRLGLMYVSGLRAEAAARIEQERRRRPFASVDDLVRRVSLRKPELDVLAEIGALNSIRKGLHRREALWQIERAWRPRGPLLEDLEQESDPCPLNPMSPMERLAADYRGAGITTGPHPMHYLRKSLNARGVLPASHLEHQPRGKLVKVAGAVIARQRPGTAKGFVFLSLEDETGISNIIVRPPVFQAHRAVLLGESFLLVEGHLQKQDGVISVRAETIQSAGKASLTVASHDFH
jgi:error-prone DNA polymerase